MKLLRHILSHLLLITFLVAIALAYYFRPMVFPDRVNSKINGWVESVYPPAVRLVYHKPQQSDLKIKNADASVATLEMTPVVEAKEPLVVKEESPVPVSIKEKEVTAVVNEVVQKLKDLVPEEEAASSVAVEPVVEQETVPSVAIAPVVEQEQPVTQAHNDASPVTVETEKTSLPVVRPIEVETLAVDSDQGVGTEQNLLVAARQAYQQKDVDAAISKYRQLIELDEHSPNAFGEMGNIYYLQGKWQEAGAAYYEAAVRLVESGQMHQVAYLHRVIQGLDRNKAEQLAVKINHGRM